MDDLDYFRFLLALLLVVGLIGLFAFLLKRLGLGGIRAPTLGKRHRLSIQEVAAIDDHTLRLKVDILMVKRQLTLNDEEPDVYMATSVMCKN